MVLDDTLIVEANKFHIYILGLDGDGNFGCIYSDDATNSYPKNGDHYNDKEISLPLPPLRVGATLGVDTYFLLASEQILTDICSIIKQDSVKHDDVEARGNVKQYVQRLSMQCLQ